MGGNKDYEEGRSGSQEQSPWGHHDNGTDLPLLANCCVWKRSDKKPTDCPHPLGWKGTRKNNDFHLHLRPQWESELAKGKRQTRTVSIY
ncbi:hypothetical protein PoB_006116100 [Plakobranchus ocellatus]|uniref:Uncharacterized protein n=1 Tax=Plakobranchus ocellatus TaxID=259542 RepID=A0AAV4CS28_9GAST|nr:hypothetical protein PoB_006116100 [Plakobranchus ocellatus]